MLVGKYGQHLWNQYWPLEFLLSLIRKGQRMIYNDNARKAGKLFFSCKINSLVVALYLFLPHSWICYIQLNDYMNQKAQYMFQFSYFVNKMKMFIFKLKSLRRINNSKKAICAMKNQLLISAMIATDCTLVLIAPSN